MGELDGVEVMICRTGYTGEQGVELMCMADDADALWDAAPRARRHALRPRSARHAPARGLLPAARQRHHRGDGRDLRRARLDVRAREGVHRRGGAPTIKAERACKLVAVRDGGEAVPGRRCRSTAVERSRRVRTRRRSTLASAWATFPPRSPTPGTELVDRRARPAAARARRREADLHPEEHERMAAAESYPDDLKYHGDHDWARVDGDEAVLGITWFAQDALGELSTSRRRRPGRRSTKDETYGEVESVKAVSDVIAPLSGEVLEVNERAVDEPEIVNDDPYGEGWLVRIRMSDPSELDALLDARTSRSARRDVAATQSHVARDVRPLAARWIRRTDATGGDARRDRGLLDRRPLRADSRRRPARPPARRRARARPRPSSTRLLEELAARNAHTGVGSSPSWAWACTTTTCRPSSTPCSRAASC